MRRLLLALPFALLTLAVAQAAETVHDHDHAHGEANGSLEAHEHGVARLNAVLDGTTLELELESPAINLVGFEHVAHSDADKAKVSAARALLAQPLTLFALAEAATCTVTRQDLESPLFGDSAHDEAQTAEHKEHEQHEDNEKHEGHHSEVHAHYQFTCKEPAALEQLDLTNLFTRFPATQKIQVQLIGPSGQQGTELSPGNSRLAF
ncbi:MAG: DUF2796 domain-containing protein [Pseudomonas sp.]|uniref:DUF2796 domain-containing protein n=1 Tax=Pseudomonas sp. TaxID=306 RepID=UPI003393F4D6